MKTQNRSRIYYIDRQKYYRIQEQIGNRHLYKALLLTAIYFAIEYVKSRM